MSYIACFWVCSPIYSPCKPHAPYFIVICGLSLYTIIFTHYLIRGTIFGEIFIEPKIRVSIFSTILSKKFLILGRNEWVIFINVPRYWYKVQVILVISTYMSLRPTAFEFSFLYSFKILNNFSKRVDRRGKASNYISKQKMKRVINWVLYRTSCPISSAYDARR